MEQLHLACFQLQLLLSQALLFPVLFGWLLVLPDSSRFCIHDSMIFNESWFYWDAFASSFVKGLNFRTPSGEFHAVTMRQILNNKTFGAEFLRCLLVQSLSFHQLGHLLWAGPRCVKHWWWQTRFTWFIVKDHVYSLASCCHCWQCTLMHIDAHWCT